MMKSICIILLLLTICAAGTAFFAPAAPKAEPLPFAQTYASTVLLIPLDSRPACTDFAAQLGNTAKIRVLLPPRELLDHYKSAGDTAALQRWCLENAPRADAVIVSIDMLLHGGLLASRRAEASDEEIARLLRMLERLRAAQPALPVYAFHILPRLWPADNAINNRYQKEILSYSKLVDQVYTFENPRDIQKLTELEAKLPRAVRDGYRRVYEKNFALNEQLIALAERGVLDKLVIGQDDGESFGIPNLFKRRLLHRLQQDGVPSRRVFVTKGADELALTLLAELHGRRARRTPKICVQYDSPPTAGLVLPFMATSVATTAREKIALLRGAIVDSPDEADFVLFIYVGSDRNIGGQSAAGQQIQTLLAQGRQVALVDLSEHFSPDETILPVLIRSNAPISRLIAYSGWNTASNAIGMATAQASIFTAALPTAATDTERLSLYKNNLTFLTNRYLEDYFYMKEAIDVINRSLSSERTDIYRLDGRYPWADALLKADMINRTARLKAAAAYNHPLMIRLDSGPLSVKITDLRMEVSYPWERTFEINLKSSLNLKKAY